MRKGIGAGSGTTGRRRSRCAGACGNRAPGTVSVIVSPAARDEAGQLRSSNHQALADAGATFLAVDIAGSAMETLADQFRGFTTVINCMGFVAGPGTQLKITRAVLAAGVPRYFPGSLASITMW